MKEIYILHEYDIKSHFEALYKADNNEFIIKDYIVLSKLWIIKKVISSILKGKSIKSEIRYLRIHFNKIRKLKDLENEVCIVGIAPYDKLLNKYRRVFSKNKCIYFTLWEYWDGSQFPKGSKDNKETFERILKENFLAAACITNKTKDGVKKIISECEVVNHSIVTKEYKKYDKKIGKVKNFIFLGQYIERKGIYDILDWIKTTEKDNFTFTFAGYGPLEKEINKIMSEHKNVKNIGKLSKQEIKNELGKYDFLILPSKKEPFGIVIIEALACGVPVISSNVVGPAEIITNNENGFLFNNKEEFKKLMNNLCNFDNEMYMKLSRNTIIKAEEYDCNNIVNRWNMMINKII